MAILAEQIGAAAHRGEQRIKARGIVVIDVLLSRRDAEDALAQHHGAVMFNEAVVAPVGEVSAEFIAEALGAVNLRWQQAATLDEKVAEGKISVHTVGS